MLVETKRDPLIDNEKLKPTTITLSYSEIEILMETLSFAKSIYASSARSKKQSDNNEDRSLAYNHEYNSLLIQELMDKIIKDGRLADYGGILQ